MLRVLLAVSANFPDNLRIITISGVCEGVKALLYQLVTSNRDKCVKCIL